MTAYKTEYRINKKGAECFRTENYEIAKAKLATLSAKRSGVYTMQRRSVQLDRYGVAHTDASGHPLWSCLD